MCFITPALMTQLKLYAPQDAVPTTVWDEAVLQATAVVRSHDIRMWNTLYALGS